MASVDVLSRSRPLLDFAAGVLIGLSIVVALFAEMEESDGGSSHDLVLIAVGALALAMVLKLAGKDRSRHRRATPPSGSRRNATELGVGWTVERQRGDVVETHATSSSSKEYKTSGDGRTSSTRPELEGVHRDARASAADGESRRL